MSIRPIANRCALALAAIAGIAGAVHAATPTAAAGAGSDQYFRMKPVQIVDQTAAQGKGMPAYDLMIPTTWTFKGHVNQGVADGGCFADWFSPFGEAKSADGGTTLQILPQYTWQYIDDPQAQRQIEKENQDGAKYGIKPCALRRPVHAADFLRDDLIAKYRKGKTVVAIEPYPELNRIVRRRLGLPEDGTGNPGGIHTEAARARLAFDDNGGRPIEEWTTAVIVVRALQAGRAVAYDWHAIMILDLVAPKGQLDGNDRLLKLIASTIHPEPAWQQYSNGVINTLYRKKQEEEAKRSEIIAQFQAKVAATIMGVVANQQRGAENAAFGESQVIRGVQTFRDPASGRTMELSNLYDHAWLNGQNEYIMSDDPNFDPNGKLDGNWNSLQLVRPQP